MGTVLTALCKISGFFDWIIYEVMTYAYVLFASLCKLDPSNLGETFNGITDRIKVLFGILMLFIIAFNLLQFLADPGKIEGESSKLIQKIAISILLLVSSGFIFQTMATLQQKIIEARLIEQLVMGEAEGASAGYDETGTYNEYMGTGRWFSYNMIFSFIHIDENAKKEIMSGTQSLKYMLSYIKSDNYEFPIVSGICGIFVVVMFVTFAIEIGVRAFNLLILQVISPIPIMANIAPGGDKILDKYIKAYMATYLELFIKLFTIYLTLYLMVNTMGSILETARTGITGAFANDFQKGSMFGSVIPSGAPDFLRVVIVALVFIALFKFSQAVPKMLGDIFGLKFDNMGGMFKTTGAIVAGGLGLGLGTMGGLAAGIKGRAGVLGTMGAIGKGAFGGLSNGARAKNVKDFFATQKTNKDGVNKYASDIGAAGGVGRSFLNNAASSIDATAAFFRGDQRKIGENQIAQATNKKSIEKNSGRAAVHQKFREYENKVHETGLKSYLKANNFSDREAAIKYRTAAAAANLDVAKRSGDAAAIKTASEAYQTSVKTANAALDRDVSTYINSNASTDAGLREAFDELNTYVGNNSKEFAAMANPAMSTSDLKTLTDASDATMTSIAADRRSLESEKAILEREAKGITDTATHRMAEKAKTNAEESAVRRGYNKDSK